jgi:predicted small lipoprotein YifL
MMRQLRSVAIAPECKKARLRLTLRGLLALVSVGLVSAACGQKGPLTLPKASPAASAASVPAR